MDLREYLNLAIDDSKDCIMDLQDNIINSGEYNFTQRQVNDFKKQIETHREYLENFWLIYDENCNG